MMYGSNVSDILKSCMYFYSNKLKYLMKTEGDRFYLAEVITIEPAVLPLFFL